MHVIYFCHFFISNSHSQKASLVIELILSSASFKKNKSQISPSKRGFWEDSGVGCFRKLSVYLDNNCMGRIYLI